MIKQEQIDKCVTVACKYGANRLVLFGSAVETPELARDIDLLCDGVEGVDLIKMGAEMEDEVHTSVDIVSLTPMTRFVRNALSNGRVLYEAGRI